MEGISIIIAVFNKVETTVKCVELITEENRGDPFEIIIVDNGSTDETPNVIARSVSDEAILVDEIASPTARNDKKSNITYIRNEQNLGVARALNIGAAAARYEILCFMHNDVFIHEKNWSAKIGDFILKTPTAGVVGLYGAKILRKDGSFRGKTIVHAKRGGPSMNTPFEQVAVVDGLLMAIKKPVFKKIGGFYDGFIMHFYDKDISLRAYENGLANYVLKIPFEHRCGTTREQIKKDDTIRDEAQKKFVEIWKKHLPADVSKWQERVAYIFRKGAS